MKRTVRYKSHEMRFNSPSGMTDFRVNSFATKEPWTLDWIENNLKEDSVFWDIGANIGIYTIFAATATPCKTILAFEPAYYNYNELCINTILNQKHDVITPYCIGVSNETSLNKVNISCEEIGSSGHDVKYKRRSGLTTGCVTFSVDEMVEMGLKSPTHIKIDVDGIEPFIIRGMKKTLETVESLLVEFTLSDLEHMAIVHDINNMGFELDRRTPFISQRARLNQRHFYGYGEYIFHRKKK